MARARKAAGEAAPAAPSRLARYQEKRDFARTPEPRGRVAAKPRAALRFVVHKHAARRLHYDLRLEHAGILLSFAVTRGPSLVPGEKRLAVRTEDHPLDYLTFEGVIPQGAYGGGAMIVWDAGTFAPEGEIEAGLAKGKLTIALSGERLSGRFHLVRTKGAKGKAASSKENWLLLKSDDEGARAAGEPDVLEEHTTSLTSGLTVEGLLAGGEEGNARAKPKLVRAPSRRAVAKPAAIPGAKKAALPAFVPPALSSLVETPPSGARWVHEIKFDGYRLQARVEDGRARLLTRNGHDWTDRFAPLAEALSALPARSALIDGEGVVEDKAGVSDFAGLQATLKSGDTRAVVYHAFDLLHLDGQDLTALPLLERKRLLALLLDDLPAGGALRFSDHILEDGPGMLRHACRIGLEGIISKRADAPYRSGRGDAWRKAKCVARQDFVIAGFVPATSRKKAVGALVLGVYEGGDLVPVGRVGTGFDEASARMLHDELTAIAADASPFARPLSRPEARGVRFSRPERVAEIAFRGWTGEGYLRHASFKGLREDMDPRAVGRETAADARPQEKTMADETPGTVAGITLSNPDRVLWEGQGVTKLGLADYYAEIADAVLPHIAGRPLSLVRCPSGAEKTCFYAKHPFAGLDEAVLTVDLGKETVIAVENLRGLVSLVQAGTLEIHPWGSRLEDVERPDRLVFDLDPGERVGYAQVIEAAREVRARLAEMGLESFVKTTGGKGLHVVVPIAPQASWEEAKAFCAGVAAAMAADSPDRFTDTLAKKARVGRIFVDYLRNGRGATAIAPYSPRARPGAPVATPLDWSELTEAIPPDHFTVETVPTRLRHLDRDPFAALAEIRQDLPNGKGRGVKGAKRAKR